MVVPAVVIILIVTTTTLFLLIKLLRALLIRLDTDSRLHFSEFTFEDPFSLTKVPAPSLFNTPKDGQPTKTLSIVIPAYNEAERLPSTLDETLAYLAHRRDRQGPNFTYEVLIVDDGSRDGTGTVAFKYVRQHGFDAVRVLRLPRNKGKGYAVKAGMMCSRGAKVLLMDADGATAVSEVEKLESAMKSICATTSSTPTPTSTPLIKPQLGFVLGSRAHLQETAMAHRTWLRNILMHGFHALVTLVVGNTIRDTQCGFKLFTRATARLLFPNQRLQRWAFDVELVRLAQVFGVPMAEVQVTWTEIPGSKVRVTSIVHIAFELVLVALGYRSGVWRAEGAYEVPRLMKKVD